MEIDKRGNMQTSEARKNHRTVGTSTTLSRRYTKRPKLSNDITVNVKRSPKVQHFAVTTEEEQQTTASSRVNMQAPTRIHVQTADVLPATQHPLQQSANAKMRARTMVKPAAKKMTAKELKDQAIRKALASAENFSGEDKKKVKTKAHFSFGRVMLALGCAAAAVAAIVYFVNINMPDISLKVAAMQTGIDPSYPTYVPRNYSISSITSEEGKITMEFRNSSEGTKFYLIEENSSWDTTALLNNYVKKEYSENYSTVREQGLTIYIDGSNAAWVNGGNVFKIIADNGVLTNKQIRSIAVSL